MIDAYEIGIQLLLQDDVSAGLAVINRGLAEVDRAIAATSASLVGLVGETEQATKAVAAAAGIRVLPTGKAEPKSVISSENATLPSTKGIESTREAAFVNVVRDHVADVPISPAKATSVADQQPIQAAPVFNTVDRGGDVNAPVKPTISQVELPSPRPSVPETEFTGAPVAPVANTKSASLDAPHRQSVRGTTAVHAGTQQKSPMPSSPMAVTATIGKARIAPSPTVERYRAGPQVTHRLSVERDRAAAPWANIAQAAPQSPMPRQVERAVAPQAQGREHAGGGGGAVMLDGRLVGQWLSEHLGREASRPPGGTSFFDARQTPAWNVSGAL